MASRVGGRFRLVAVGALTLALAACMAIERPRVGTGPPVITPKQVRLLGAAPIRGEEARFSFTPLTGLPAELAFRMQDSLVAQAAIRKITIVEEGDPTATYVVKGYLSAVGNANGTLMVYVWDIFDTTGRRIHRISGQEPAAGAASDPWEGISTTVMDDAARQTIDALADWSRA